MSSRDFSRRPWVPPAAVALAAVLALGFWLARHPETLPVRIPGTDRRPDDPAGTNANAVLAGSVTHAPVQPQKLPGTWPQFRGPGRDGIAAPGNDLARTWPASGLRELWGVDVGEGYAGPAVHEGRVYLMDYDRERKQDALRCLSLADGQEIWRFAYPVPVKRNHGMSRTVPALNEKVLVAMGPKCHVVCLDPISGSLRWGMDLVRQFGTTVPPWYAGQCPLIDGEAVVLAPGGPQALLAAVSATGTNSQTGDVLWKTPNPRNWKMTHSSIMPMEFGGERMYVYCADKGVVGVSAKTGALLWETADWKISIATVPTPVILSGGRIFLSGGYNAGSLMLQLRKDGEKFTAQSLYRLPAEVFGATQQTPILFNDYLYGVRPDGKLACLDLEGKPVWTSDAGHQFGLGAYLMADGLIYAVNDNGLLRLVEATPDKYNLLGQAQVLKGREAWGPLALAGGRLLVRDLTRMVCLEVGKL